MNYVDQNLITNCYFVGNNFNTAFIMNIKRFGNLYLPVIAGIAILFLLNNSCKHDGITADQMAPVAFAEVQQVYSDYCIRCHSGSNGGESRLDFSTYTGILRTVSPGNSSKSKSYQAMIKTFQIMPPNGAVPTSKRTLIRLWIDQGAKPE
jgi:uncharacterized membrane protein